MGGLPASALAEEFGTPLVAYCERHGIAYQLAEPKPVARRGMSYADNFAFNRRSPWTH